jgi:hypothetical protein
VQKEFLKEANRYVNIFLDCCEYQEKKINVRLLADNTIVLLHDAWARFCRSLIIVSAANNTISVKGHRISKLSGIKNRSDVIPKLLSTYKKKKFEPRWADAGECIDAAYRLRIGNYQQIMIALSVHNSPVDEIRRLRNFLVHRNHRTACDVRSKFNLPTKQLTSINIAGDYITGGIRRIEHWMNILTIMSNQAIQ